MQVALLIGINCPTISAADVRSRLSALGKDGCSAARNRGGDDSLFDLQIWQGVINAKRFCLMPNDLISGGVHCII
jgi:hypothetical protein